MSGDELVHGREETPGQGRAAHGSLEEVLGVMAAKEK